MANILFADKSTKNKHTKDYNLLSFLFCKRKVSLKKKNTVWPAEKKKKSILTTMFKKE